MGPLQLLLNLLWVLLGGWWMAVAWAVAGILMALTIVGLPWARAAFTIAGYAFLPFGRRAVSRAAYLGRGIWAPGLWARSATSSGFLLAGWWLALGHLFTAFLLAITIIGLPFAWAHVKLAGLALWPIGKMIVDDDDIPYARAGGR